MSPHQAAEKATKLAVEFLSREDTKGFTGDLVDARPDPTENEKNGKVLRYWVSLVCWRRDDSELDGPSVIRIDLIERKCWWG
jgi:hypothetical protein